MPPTNLYGLFCLLSHYTQTSPGSHRLTANIIILRSRRIIPAMNNSPKCTTNCIFFSTPLSDPSVHTCHLTYTEVIPEDDCLCPNDREKELSEIEKQNEAEMERYYREEERKEQIRNEMKEDYLL